MSTRTFASRTFAPWTLAPDTIAGGAGAPPVRTTRLTLLGVSLVQRVAIGTSAARLDVYGK